MPRGWRDDPTLFVAIAPDGTVTITCHRQEMGQGVRTSVALVVADELDADWAKVKLVQAHGDEDRFGNQDTDGSRSLRHFFMPLRRAGAAARAMLIEAAAQQWKVPAAEVTAENGTLVHAKSGRKLGYGDVAEAAAKLTPPDRAGIALKDPSAFRYIGKGKIGSSTTATSPPARRSTASTPASRGCSTPSSPGRRSSAASSRPTTPPRR